MSKNVAEHMLTTERPSFNFVQVKNKCYVVKNRFGRDVAMTFVGEDNNIIITSLSIRQKNSETGLHSTELVTLLELTAGEKSEFFNTFNSIYSKELASPSGDFKVHGGTGYVTVKIHGEVIVVSNVMACVVTPNEKDIIENVANTLKGYGFSDILASDLANGYLLFLKQYLKSCPQYQVLADAQNSNGILSQNDLEAIKEASQPKRGGSLNVLSEPAFLPVGSEGDRLLDAAVEKLTAEITMPSVKSQFMQVLNKALARGDQFTRSHGESVGAATDDFTVCGKVYPGVVVETEGPGVPHISLKYDTVDHRTQLILRYPTREFEFNGFPVAEILRVVDEAFPESR